MLGYEKGPVSVRLTAAYRDKYLDEVGGGPDEDRYVAFRKGPVRDRLYQYE